MLISSYMVAQSLYYLYIYDIEFWAEMVSFLEVFQAKGLFVAHPLYYIPYALNLFVGLNFHGFSVWVAIREQVNPQIFGQ